MQARPFLLAAASVTTALLVLASCHNDPLGQGGGSRYPGGGGGGGGTLPPDAGPDGGECQFPTGTFYSADASVVAMATGDLNADGLAEVVVAGGTVLEVWHGLADGGLLGPDTYATLGNSSAVQIGDFNGDSFIDVAVVNNQPQNSTQLFAGAGTGVLAAPLTGPGQSFVTSATSGDFNQDGLLDLALASDNLVTGQVSVLLNPTPTTAPFSGQYVLDNSRRRAGIAVADVTSDSVPDLISTDPLNGQATVFAGYGDGGFAALPPVDAGLNPTAIVTEDLNLDLFTDAVVASTNERALYVLPGSIDGGLSTGIPIAITPGFPVALSAGSWTGDGLPGVATAETTPSGLGLYSWNLDAGVDGGTFGLITSFLPPSAPLAVSLQDTTGDGKLDLVGLIDGGIIVYPALCP
jgi:hypothetical protein